MDEWGDVLVSSISLPVSIAYKKNSTLKGAQYKLCSLKADETYFEKNTPHSLNERIQITVDGDLFVVGHPPVVQAATAIAFFNHDVFQGVLSTPTGAKAIEIEVVETEAYSGPWLSLGSKTSGAQAKKIFTVVKNCSE